MTQGSNELKIGIPKGSLEEATIALFAKSGWKITMRARNYFPEVNDPELATRLCRPQEMPRYVADGVLDAGLTGKDWILENNAAVQVVSDLIYSKTSNKPAHWVLAVAGDSPYQKPEDLAGKRVATEITGLTERYFKSKNIPVKVEYSWGATEAKVVEGLADAIVEVTETGTTIRAHGLRVIDEVLVTNTQLIACPASWADPWKRKKIEQINMLLQGALRAESLVGLKMNAQEADLQQIIALLPSLNSPTISSLRDSDWHALEVIVSVAVVRDLIPRLVEAGAKGIIEYPLNKVI
jgi:ATP phosphoribosyltransferase